MLIRLSHFDVVEDAAKTLFQSLLSSERGGGVTLHEPSGKSERVSRGSKIMGSPNPRMLEGAGADQ
jgi:hypothetical protein